MKIAIIGQKGIPSTSGGVEKHVEELSVRLAGLGNDVLVYTRRGYSDKNIKEYRGVRLQSLPSISTKHMDAIIHTFLACLHLVFRERKIDVVHFHSIGPSSLLWLVKVLKPRTPVVATFHTRCYIHKKWGGFAKFSLKMGEFVCNSFADEVIAISRNLQQYAQIKYKKRINFIPNGVSVEETKEAEIIKKKWGLEKDNYIVSISRLVRHKGIQYLIEAYQKLATDKKLVIVGGGAFTDDYVAELKEMAKGNDNIIFTGQQSGDVLRELFSNAYLFVQPSESEGLSIALLEAMAFGLSVLASDIPENVEAVRNMGFYFQNKNVADLQNQLSDLLANPEKLLEKKHQAVQRIKLNYNWDTIARDTLLVYERSIMAKRFIFNKKQSII